MRYQRQASSGGIVRLPAIVRLAFGAFAAAAFVVVASSAGPAFAAARPIGIASGSLGSATVNGRPIAVGTPVFEGSEIKTGPTDSASLLLSSKVVVKIDADTDCVIREAKGTHIELLHGNVEVFLSKRGPVQGAVALSDPEANIEALGTVFIASYQPATRDGYYATLESKRPQGISVKGTGDANATDLAPGKQITLHAGVAQGGPVDLNPGDVKSHLGQIVDLDTAQLKQAGIFSRQQTALAEFRQVARAASGGRFAGAIAANLSDLSQGKAINDAVQWRTVTRLVAGGDLSSSGGNSGGSGGSSSSGGNSTGGFSNATILLPANDIFNFRLFDSGVADGDQVSIRVSGRGGVYLSVSRVTLSTTGVVFQPTVQPGNISVTLTALNEGSIPLNTGGVSILNTVSAGKSTQSYGISSGQTATLQIKTK